MDLSRGWTGTTSLIFDIAKRCERRSLNGTLNGRNGRRERKSSKFNASISTTTGPLLSVQLSIIIFFPDAFSAWLGSDTRTSWGGFSISYSVPAVLFENSRPLFYFLTETRIHWWPTRPHNSKENSKRMEPLTALSTKKLVDPRLKFELLAPTWSCWRKE